MSALAPTLQAFFIEGLIGQRRASPHTVAAYRDTFRLLLTFVQGKTGTAPSALRLEDVDAPLVGSFLDHLEKERNNSARTRNARLAAIHSLFRFAALRHPEHAALIERVLAVPPKRFERAIVSFLSDEEVDALLAAPNPRRCSDVEITHCCSSKCRRDSESPNSWVCVAATSRSVRDPTFGAPAKGARSASRRLPKRRLWSFEHGWRNEGAKIATRSLQPCTPVER